MLAAKQCTESWLQYRHFQVYEQLFNLGSTINSFGYPSWNFIMIAMSRIMQELQWPAIVNVRRTIFEQRTPFQSHVVQSCTSVGWLDISEETTRLSSTHEPGYYSQK